MHAVKPLAFDASKLRGLSERLVVSYHENNHGGAVKNLKRTEEELARVTKDEVNRRFESARRKAA